MAETFAPMVNKPISPVSVVVLSMLSRAPGDLNRVALLLTVRSGVLWKLERDKPWDVLL